MPDGVFLRFLFLAPLAMRAVARRRVIEREKKPGFLWHCFIKIISIKQEAQATAMQTISILPLNGADCDKIADLTVDRSQMTFIESSEKCLEDFRTNAYGIVWHIHGFYLGETLIGFAMHGRQTFKMIPYSQVWLDRFLIDRRFQGKGYGREVLQRMIPLLYETYECKRIFLSVKEDNLPAIKLYESLEFQKTMFKEPGGERIMTRRKRA